MEKQFNPSMMGGQPGQGQEQQMSPEDKFFKDIVDRWKQSKGGNVSFDAEAGFREGMGQGVKMAGMNQSIMMHDQKLFAIYSIMVGSHLDKFEEAMKEDKTGGEAVKLGEGYMRTALSIAKAYGDVFTAEVKEMVEEARKSM